MREGDGLNAWMDAVTMMLAPASRWGIAALAVEFARLQHRERVAVLLVGRVQDHDVEAAELRDGPVDDVRAELLLLQVALEGEGLHARVADPAQRLVGILPLLGKVRDGDIRTLSRERDCDCAADAGVASRDECATPLQLA
jgi:hypothetical protein